MDSRSVAILAPRWGRTGDWTLQRRYGSRLSPLAGQDRRIAGSRWPIYLFTTPKSAFTMPKRVFTMTETSVHDPRNRCSRWSETGVHDRPKHASFKL